MGIKLFESYTACTTEVGASYMLLLLYSGVIWLEIPEIEFMAYPVRIFTKPICHGDSELHIHHHAADQRRG